MVKTNPFPLEVPMMPVLTLVLGLCLGILLATATYASELKRLARFLRTRAPHSNARATSSTGAPGVRDLADAINAELDRTAQERIDAQRHQDEFQRDLSALSHDIRTPLTGAKGYLQLARDEADAAARGHDLEAAAARIDNTTALLDELFAYTKSTDPDLALDLHEVALQPLIERVLVGHYPAFEAHGWEPKLSMPGAPDSAPLTVRADPEALSRILENLVTNAVRHGSGAPRIRVQRLEAHEARGSARSALALTVENPVPSDADIDVDRLFDRFYQADAARHTTGSGLGLAVSANLARAMGMELSARLHDGIPRMLSITLACPL